jgi:hydroxymethylglutaryl-CoA reductase
MNKRTVRLLGQLLAVKVKIWKEERHSIEEWANKLKLLDHIFEQIEENARGFKKSKLPYELVGAFLIEGENYKLPYSEIHEAVTEILLKKDTEP